MYGGESPIKTEDRFPNWRNFHVFDTCYKKINIVTRIFPWLYLSLSKKNLSFFGSMQLYVYNTPHSEKAFATSSLYLYRCVENNIWCNTHIPIK